MFGLDWGMPPDAALARLGLAPVDRDDAQVAVALDQLVGRLIANHAFCPSLFIRLGDTCEGRLHLAFDQSGLAGGELRFRYPFEAIGKSSDGLSDQAMASYARHELQGVIFEFVARYGAPLHSADGPMRWDLAHPVGVAVFAGHYDDVVQLVMGHDGAGVIGAIRYLPRPISDAGF